MIRGRGLCMMGPEQGGLPGMTVVCGDSHTSTHGAAGALDMESAHPRLSTLATQCLFSAR